MATIHQLKSFSNNEKKSKNPGKWGSGSGKREKVRRKKRIEKIKTKQTANASSASSAIYAQGEKIIDLIIS